MTPIACLALAALIDAATCSQAATSPSRAVELGLRSVQVVGDATKAATVEPNRSTFVNAATLFAWSDGAIFHAYASPGRVTDIMLQRGEMLGSVASGDTARWTISDVTSGSGPERRTHVLVKPFAAGITTNIVIATDRRTYHLLLTSVAGASMTVLSWVYPADDLVALRKADVSQAPTAPPVATGLDLSRLHFDYAITGDRPSWRPLRAFDDGQQLFIEFPKTLAVDEAPPLFAIGADGTAELVNYRVRDRFYIVDRLLGIAELRLGLKKPIVVRIARTLFGSARKGKAS